MLKRKVQKNVQDIPNEHDEHDIQETQDIQENPESFDEVSKKPSRNWFRIAVMFLLLLIFAVGFIILLWWQSYVIPQSNLVVSQITTQHEESSMHTELYYKDNETGEWRLLETLYDGEQTQWVSYKNIPVDLRNAAVAIEDKRFWEHDGVDWYRTCGAVVNTIKHFMTGSGSIEGGSTITQQLIKNMTGHDSITVSRKVMEIVEAGKLEEELSKEEIMEMYLNHIYFGYNSYGIFTASYTYFNKSVMELDLAECAVLMSITNNPSYYDPYRYVEHVMSRAKSVLMKMCDQDYITEEERDEALAQIGYSYQNGVFTFSESDVGITFENGSLSSMIRNGGDATDGQYNWFTDAVIEELISDFVSQGMSRKEATNVVYHGGLDIYTTYDPDVQEAIDAVYEDTSLYEQYVSASGDALESAIVVLNQDSGAVVGMAGGIGIKEGNRLWNRAVDSKLAPASTLKPFSVYIPAIEEGLLEYNSTVTDEPFQQVSGNDWPVNEYQEYRGTMSLADAVAYSTNTVAVSVLDEFGLDTSYEWLTKKFGLSLNEDRDKDYAPLALGGLTNGVSVLDMTSLYATIPMNGKYKEPYYYTYVEDAYGDVLFSNVDLEGVFVYSEKTADTMESLLRDVVEYGTGVNAQLSIDTYGKTGTSNDTKDQWFCGYDAYYTAAVWCGYDTAQTIPVTDENVAVQIWHDVMQGILDTKGWTDE